VYLGPHASPDFESDYLLSPVHAPEDLLAQFPKTYMICGEKDPLVDDTVIFAGRIRQAKRKHRQDNPLDEDFPSGDGVRVKFLEGISHAFLQMMPFLPEAQQAAKTIGDWVKEMAESNKNSQNTSIQNSQNRGGPGTNNITTTVHPDNSDITIQRVSFNSELGDHHVAEIITSEKDMIHRRKQQLVNGLF
jgi:hypothetical protein